MIELKIDKHYIVQSKYPTEEFPKYFKMGLKEVTDKTYLISNIDTIMFSTQPVRYNKEEFNVNFTILEEIDIPVSGNTSDINNIIMNARNYGKNTVEYYYPKWTPFGPTLD